MWNLVPIDKHLIQLLHPRLRDHYTVLGRTFLRARETGNLLLECGNWKCVYYTVLVKTDAYEASPTCLPKSELYSDDTNQHGCVNKGKFIRLQLRTKNDQKLKFAKTGSNVFPREKQTNWLSDIEPSALKTDTYKYHYIIWTCCI